MNELEPHWYESLDGTQGRGWTALAMTFLFAYSDTGEGKL